MNICKISLQPLASYITPWQADTLFGHLCWTVAFTDGENALKRFLAPFLDGEPPFVLSDGFPSELLPLPLAAARPASGPITAESYDRAKRLKQTDLVSLELFNRALRLEPLDVPERLQEPSVAQSVMHNTINRLTSATPDEGGLHAHTEWFASDQAQTIAVYAKVAAGFDIERLEHLLDLIARRGYGKRMSVGKGNFQVLSCEPFTGFSPPEDANAFVSLSNFVPAADDPTEGCYQTFVKYGKLGGGFAHGGHPFKLPLLMLKSGSCFRTDTTPKDFYGKMIRGIAPQRPEVVQYAYAFTVGLKMPPSGAGSA